MGAFCGPFAGERELTRAISASGRASRQVGTGGRVWERHAIFTVGPRPGRAGVPRPKLETAAVVKNEANRGK